MRQKHGQSAVDFLRENGLGVGDRLRGEPTLGEYNAFDIEVTAIGINSVLCAHVEYRDGGAFLRNESLFDFSWREWTALR